MTLFQIIQILKEIALAQPNIKSATDGSIYDIMNTNPSVKYDVVHFSQTTHQSDEETDYYGLNIFYVSRLEDSLEDNRLQIQSIGKEVLDNIIRTFCENWGIDFPIITYTPFTQKFNDLCAGCYCNLRLEIPKEIICADDYVAEVVPGSGIKLQDIGITITQNGLIVITPDAEYDGIGEIRIQTEVPQSAAVLQDKEVEYTENGSYTIHPDPAYDGLSSVSVDVDVPDRYDEGYDDGKQDGENEQKAKLAVTSFTENNTYTRENGWSAVTVDVPSDYQDGYDDGFGDGEEAQKAKLSSTSFTQNDTYTIENGWSAVTVDVPSDYQDGYDDGVAYQKAKMVATAITENGEYGRPDGYSAITVNVPQGQGYEEGYEDGEAAQKAKLTTTSFTQNDTYTRADGWSSVTVNVDDRYDEGYADGFAAGASACSGLFISAITLNVDSAITDSATATTTFSPLTAITDIYYTSSDPSIATIDSGTGVITAIANGSVTICTKDRWTGLQDCKNVTVAKSSSCTTLRVVYYVTSTAQPTQILSTDSNANFNYFSKMTYNGNDYTIRTGFTFPSSGLQSIEYTLANGYTRMGAKVFKDVATVREAYFSSCISETVLAEFENSGLKKVQLNDGLQTIGIAAFWNCNLTSLTVPDSVKVIGTESFQDCQSLTSVTIGSGVTQIGWAFYRCSSLTRITIMATTPPTLVPTAGTDTIRSFDDTNNCPIYVPADSVNAYKTATSWSKYASRITAQP